MCRPRRPDNPSLTLQRNRDAADADDAGLHGLQHCQLPGCRSEKSGQAYLRSAANSSTRAGWAVEDANTSIAGGGNDALVCCLVVLETRELE